MGAYIVQGRDRVADCTRARELPRHPRFLPFVEFGVVEPVVVFVGHECIWMRSKSTGEGLVSASGGAGDRRTEWRATAYRYKGR